MWQTFQGALEKKVKLTQKKGVKKKQRVDKYLIEKAFKDVLLEQFGKIGLGFINLEIENPNNIKVKCKNSSWKSEIRMRKNILINEVNEKIGDSVVVNIFIN